jgi:phosphoglycerate dehydrogenase-like enzyme
MRITILDDYQNVALRIADWSRLTDRYEIDAVTEHIADADQLVARLASSRVVVAMRERTAFPREILERLPDLKLLISTGMHNVAIDVDAARELGIVVSGTGGSEGAVPELVFGMMIALGRGFVAEDAAVHAGGWQHTIGPGLYGSTLGIVGLGRLGSQVATLARAFGMHVLAWSPNLTQERADQYGARSVGKRELFTASDFVTVHMPPAPGTIGIVGAEELGWMPPHAYLINTSRGPLVTEVALVDSLGQKRIAGAGLDVYDEEPLPADHPLRGLPNALLLPHIGYVTESAYAVFYADAIEDITSFEAGTPIRLM